MRRAGRFILQWAAIGCAYAGLPSAQGVGPRIVPPAEATSYRLVFEDNFDSLDLSPDGSGAHTWYEGVWFNQYHAPINHISTADSVLSLRWRSGQDSPNTSVSTFSVSGRESHAWRYGYFEARMKWDVVRGAWPAFWLIPVQDAEGMSTYNSEAHKKIRESGEIDIFEGQGDQPHVYFGTIHDWIDLQSTANENNHFTIPENADLKEFHTYGLLWTPGKVSWYLDHHLLHAEKTPPVFDKQDFFLVLSMQEGVNWKIGDRSGVTGAGVTPREMNLSVDWVRVWQK